MFRNRTRFCRFVAALTVASAVLCAGSDRQRRSAPSSSIATARSEVNRGHLDSAEKILWDALSSNANDEAALTLMGVALEKQKRDADAEELFPRTLQVNPKTID